VKILVFVFILACVLLWLPAERYAPMAGVVRTAPRPAGEITDGFHLEQLIVVPNVIKRTLSKNKEVCFGIRFATYRRENEGKIAVGWRQGTFAKRWLVEVNELADNERRYFCPDRHLKLDMPFSITIDGIHGVPGSSPTVWLTVDASYGQATINGKSAKQGLDVGIGRKVHLTPARLIRLDQGAFLVGWLCTLLAGLATLLWMQGTSSAETNASERID
jgi:hypothetical protein